MMMKSNYRGWKERNMKMIKDKREDVIKREERSKKGEGITW